MKVLNQQNLSIEKRLFAKSISLYESKGDAEIWEDFKNGNGEAFNYIYCHYFPILFVYGHQFSKNRELIKDLIQDLFLNIKVNRKKLGPTLSIKFYLFKSFRRMIIKKKAKLTDFSYDDYGKDFDFEITLSHERNLIEDQKQKELKEKLEKAINSLTKKQKEIIIYYYYEGFTYKQIASIMGFSKTEYARKLIYRSVEALKKQFPEKDLLIMLLVTKPLAN